MRTYTIDRVAERRYLEVLHDLPCRGEHCPIKLGLPFSDANVDRLTPDGLKPPVYVIDCPRNYGDEYCAYAAAIVFLPGHTQHPERLALDVVRPLLEKECLICHAETHDWRRAVRTRTHEDEVKLLLPCGKRAGNFLQHHIRWVLEDIEIPDKIPSEWRKLVPVGKR